jgi:hypothetical protein
MGDHLRSIGPRAKQLATAGGVVAIVDSTAHLRTASLLVIAGSCLLGLAMILRSEMGMERERHRHELAMAMLQSKLDADY